MPERCDIAVVGAGAAGLFAGIWAARTDPAARVVCLDGASRLGAKILVAGGGRCNVTHHRVDESAYAGSSRHAIRNVLRAFGVDRTVSFFRSCGVELKQEETGKLFPVSDDAHTILNALLNAASGAGVVLRHPWRVASVLREGNSEYPFVIRREGADAVMLARRVVLATGGKSLPRTGSDGHGYEIARRLGHTVTPRVFPALVPLTLPKGHALCALSGVAVPAEVMVRSSTGKKLASFTNSVLFTHFGLSGPGILDISRYLTDARAGDPGASLAANFAPGVHEQEVDAMLVASRGAGASKFLAERTPIGERVPGHESRGMPERLAVLLCDAAGVPHATPVHALSREQRRRIVGAVTSFPLPVTGDRGFTYAEVTAGGVPLSEVHPDSMRSRRCEGLHLCGEVLDVDGRIGGFNFQWAWASGFVAGVGAARPEEV